jgi:hypothetical protein
VILPQKDLERKIQRRKRRLQHQGRSGFRTAEDCELGIGHTQTDSRRLTAMVNDREKIDIPFSQELSKAGQRLVNGALTGLGDDAIAL